MMDPAADQTFLWPLGVYFVAVVLLVSSMIAFSYFMGERHRHRLTDQPYESGITPTGSARLRFHIRFYLVAMFFVVFDLESVFLYSWAVAIREVGWAGYIEACIFIAVLVAALAYLWKRGGLEQALLIWGRKPDRKA